MLSIGLSTVVDRVPKLHLARITLVLIMLAAGAGKLMIAAGVAGAYFVILATAFIFEIAIEILFWAACAAYVDTTELKRTTPLICLAIALGGAFGGLLARALSWTVDAPDLLWVMVIFAGLAILQFAVPSDFDELQDSQSEAATGGEAPPGEWHFLRLAVRHPLLVLLALNALALTILYGIAEFLILSVYREHYPQEQELTRFLGIVFALLQACEFVLLASLSRTLLERTTPLVRNLVFPLTSLLCFLGLAFSNKLGVAVIAHVNAEAASNAIFQPVHNANFLALPLRIQGRRARLPRGSSTRAASRSPGQSSGGWIRREPSPRPSSSRVVFTLVFILINVGVGVLFLPTLIANVGSGLARPAQIRRRGAAAHRVSGRCSGHARPERRLVGLAPAAASRSRPARGRSPRARGASRSGDQDCAGAADRLRPGALGRGFPRPVSRGRNRGAAQAGAPRDADPADAAEARRYAARAWRTRSGSRGTRAHRRRGGRRHGQASSRWSEARA